MNAQTKEAIRIMQQAFIVFVINKIDTINPHREKIKRDIGSEGIIFVGRGVKGSHHQLRISHKKSSRVPETMRVNKLKYLKQKRNMSPDEGNQ